MKNGLYKINFKTDLRASAGVVYLDGGRLWGGDSMNYYTGSYRLAGDTLTAEVQSHIHTRLPEISSVFGLDATTVSLHGNVHGSIATLTGGAKEAPDLKLTVVLTPLE